MHLTAHTTLVLLSLASFATGQIPAHATWLNPTKTMFEAVLLQDGDTVHMFGRGVFEAWHARSRDGGRTWPRIEASLGTYAADLGLTATVGLPGTVLVLGYDQLIGPICWRSTDDGTSWSTATPLSSVVAPQVSSQTAILADGLDVLAVWLRVGFEVRSRRSIDGGASWLPEQLLPGAGPGSATLYCLRNGPAIDVIWSQGGNTVHQRSTDGGATWRPAPQVVAGGVLMTAVGNGNDLLVAMNTGTFRRSSNGGASWTSMTIPGHGYPLSLSQEGTRIVAASFVAFPAPSPTYAVSVSSDSGLSWSPPLLLPSPAWLVPTTAVAQGTVYVAFPGLYLDVVTSRDGGSSWQLVDGPANSVCTGPQRNIHLAFGFYPHNFHAYVGLGSSVRGTATTGTGGIAPRLWSDGLPFQGATTTLRLDNAVGGSVGALGVSFAPPTPVALGTATLWPTVSPVVLGFATSGGVGQAGAGSFALPIAIPVASALVGTTFTSQALVVDGAAVDGFTVSNAIETWLR